MQIDAMDAPALNDLPPSWDELCERGRLARQDMDRGRWIIGNLALQLGPRGERNRIDDFAREINVEKARVKEYQTVAKFYSSLPWQTLLHDYPTLVYTHFRDAMRLKTVDEALAFLEDVVAKTLTVENARVELVKRLGKPEPPRTLAEFEGVLGQAQNWLAARVFDLKWQTEVHIIIKEVKQ